MAYLVLARKYRPERFEDMVGQDHVTRTLRNAITNDRVHHAYLFCGVRGLGKTTAARILAKCLVCEQGPTPDPCNACDQCRGVNESRSVDVQEIDGASNNSVEDIRTLREQVHYLPQSARRKIYIIDEVHMLSTSAFNALLKTLEEPPPHVTFMFATTDPHKVIPTIMSRVSRLDLRRVRSDALVGHLRRLSDAEQIKISDDALDIVAGSAGGSVRDSLTALDKVIAFADDPTGTEIGADEVRGVLGLADRLAVAELAQAVFDGDSNTTLERFDAITRVGADVSQLALVFLQHLRDVAVVGACGRNDVLLDLPGRVVDRIEAQAKGVAPTVAAQFFDRFSRVLEAIEFSRAPRLVTEMALLDLARAEPLVPVGELVARLESLAAGGPGSAPGGSSSTSPGGTGSAPSGTGRRKTKSQAGPSGTDSAPSGTGRPKTKSQAGPAATTSSAASQAAETGTRAAEPVATSSPAPPRDDRAATAAASRPNDPLAVSPNAGADRPDRPPRPGVEGGISDQLWAIVQGDDPARARPRSASNGGNGAESSSSAHSSGPPDDGARFRLAATPQQSEPAPVAVVPTSDAGCPSSRFLPRRSIDLERHEPFAAWEAFLDLVRDEDELLFAVLADFGLLELTKDKLRLAAASGSFSSEQIKRPELRANLDGFAASAFGSLAIEFDDRTASEPEAPSLALVELRRRREHAELAERQAREHPALRALVDTFGARMTVSPLGDPPRT